MKTQAISNQNFTAGKVIYVQDISRHSENIEQYFPVNVRLELAKVKSIVKHKPYDLFIIKDTKTPDLYEFGADTSHYNLIQNARKRERVYVYSQILKESIIDASRDAMKNFEKIYKKR